MTWYWVNKFVFANKFSRVSNEQKLYYGIIFLDKLFLYELNFCFTSNEEKKYYYNYFHITLGQKIDFPKKRILFSLLWIKNTIVTIP